MPHIWGIIYYDSNAGRLSEIPASIREARHFSPDSPTIEILAPGSLRITRGHSVIGRIEKREFKYAIPTPFNSLSMGPVLYDLLGVEVSNGKFKNEEDGEKWGILFTCLEYLLFRIDKAGGGATIVFVPESSVEQASKQAKFPWECEGTLEINLLSKAKVQYENARKVPGSSGLFVLKANEVLRNRLNGIARLASLDGAVLITPSLDVIGFGAKLQAPSYSGTVLEGPDAFGGGGSTMDFTRLGTRHNSALNFVASVPGSVAFVASEDGPIRGLAKVASGSINCWPDCRLSMFVN